MLVYQNSPPHLPPAAAQFLHSALLRKHHDEKTFAASSIKGRILQQFYRIFYFSSQAPRSKRAWHKFAACMQAQDVVFCRERRLAEPSM